MPSLDDVTQRFVADTAPYITAIRAAAAAARDFAAANMEALASVRALQDGMNGMASSAAGSAVALRGTASAEGDVRNQSILLNAILQEVKDQTLLLGVGLTFLDDKLAALVGHAAATRAAISSLGDAFTALGVKMAAAGAAGGGGGGGGWFFGGGLIRAMGGIRNALHWIVMGTLEIAATAIPALLALGAAAVAMAPTFTHIADQMNYLRTATGSWSGVMAASVGPLQAAGAAGVRLRAAVAPDAYIIFGAAINSLVGHVGAFSQVAQQASNVLAGFASKLSAELAGPLGSQLAGFFANAVKYMIQWGQVLGNLGHAFINIFSNMFGVGQILLNVLVALTRAFAMLTGAPVVGYLIGVAAAMSAVYRYAQLMGIIFGLLNRWLIAPFVAAATWVLKLAADMAYAILVEGDMAAAMTALDLAMGPVGWTILAISAALGIWYLAAHNSADATDKLIASINKVTPTMSNIIPNIQRMTSNITALSPRMTSLTDSFNKAAAGGKYAAEVGMLKFGDAANKTSGDIQKSVAEINKLANEYVNLATGMGEASLRTGQVGAAMQVSAVQTGILDSKVQALNQATDQYIALLTGGTSAMAGFYIALQNIGTVTTTTTLANLSQSTQTLTLSTGQFAKALGNIASSKGAAAWQNLNQVINSNMAPMADWLRQMQVLGAVTGPNFSRAMLDMAAKIIPFVQGTTAGQNALLGFMAAQGLTYKSFGALQSAAGPSAGAMSNLAGIVLGASNAFSSLSQMAKNAANALSGQVSAGIAKAALASTSYSKDLQKLIQDEGATHPNAALIAADARKVAADVQTAGQRATTAGNAIYAGMTHGGAGAASGLTKAQAYQAFINAMHGTTITITTIMRTITQVGGPQYGLPYGTAGHPFHGTYVGYQAGGMVNGPGNIDVIPALLTAGEAVLNTRAVAALGGPLGVHKLNNQPSEGVLTTGGGSGGVTALALTLGIQNEMDGQVVNSNQRRATLVYNRRNPTNNLALRTR